jgi:hypothetical protein
MLKRSTLAGLGLPLCAGLIALAYSPAHASTLTYDITLTQTYGTLLTGFDFTVTSTPFTVTAPTTNYQQESTGNFSFTIDGKTYTSNATIQFLGFGPALNNLYGFSSTQGEDTLGVYSLTSFQLYSTNSPNDDIPSTIGGTVAFNEITATPLPATLPLFAGGLGFVGYLTQRKKRKAAAKPATA